MKNMIIHLQNKSLEISALENYYRANGAQYSVNHGFAKFVSTIKRHLLGLHNEWFQSWF
jgi:hypothetical protein